MHRLIRPATFATASFASGSHRKGGGRRVIVWIRRIWAAIRGTASGAGGAAPANAAPAKGSAPQEKKNDTADDAPPPPDDSAPSPAWTKAAERYRTTARWIVTSFAAVFVAALGASPFLVLDDIDSGVEVAWSIWGLTLAAGGTLAVVWAASDMSTPSTAAAGELVDVEGNKVSPSAEAARAQINATRGAIAAVAPKPASRCRPARPPARWQQPPNTNSHFTYILELEQELFGIDEEIVDELDGAARKDRLDALRQKRSIVETVLDDAIAMVHGWQGRLIHDDVRDRFRSIRPVLFVGAVFTAVGLVVFAASAHFTSDNGDDDETDETAVPAQVLLRSDEVIADLLEQLADGVACDPAQPIAVTHESGVGTDDNPWLLSFADEACGDVSFAVTRADAAVVDLTRRTATARLTIRDETLSAAVAQRGLGCEPTDVGVELLEGVGTEEAPWIVVTRTTGGCSPMQLTITADEATLFGVEPVPAEDDTGAADGALAKIETLRTPEKLSDVVAGAFPVAVIALATLAFAAASRQAVAAALSLSLFLAGLAFVLTLTIWSLGSALLLAGGLGVIAMTPVLLASRAKL